MAVTIRNNTLEFDTDSTINSIGDVGVDIDTGRLLGHDGSAVKTVAWTSDVPTLAVYSTVATVANGADAEVTHDTSVSIGLPFAIASVDAIANGVVLLLYCNGSNGSTSVPDETGKTVTVYNGASITTSYQVFGTGSLNLDGTNDYVVAPDHADFPSGTVDLTIECRARPTSLTGNAVILNHGGASEDGYAWKIRREGSTAKFYASTGALASGDPGAVFACNFSGSSPETSVYGQVVTAINGATISGGYLNTSGVGGAFTPDAAWMTFGTNDIRAEMKIVCTSLPGGKNGLIWRSTGAEYWYLYVQNAGGGTARIGVMHGGSGLATVDVYSNAFSFALNTSHHVGFQRSGTELHLFADGNRLGLSSGGTSYTFGSGAWADPADPYLNIGTSDGSRLSAHIQGQIDSIQICCSNAGNVTMYGTTYTVPSGDFAATALSWDIVNGSTLGTLTQNAWNALAVTRSGNSWSMYLNGTRGSHVTSSASLRDANGAVTIGCASNTQQEFYQGQLDEIVIRNGTASYTGASYTVPTSQTPGMYTTEQVLPMGTSDGIRTAATSASTVFTNNTGASVTARFGVVKLA
jgi:hypothetical protein